MPKNTQKKLQWEADEYLLCTHVDSDGYQYELLFTKREFDIGVKRAEKNPEDIPDYFIVLQGMKNKPEC